MRKVYLSIVLLPVLVVGIFMAQKLRSEPVRIGYVACLSGRNAELGREGLKGVQFAIEEINRAGGIGGQEVELVVADNQDNPETAWKAVNALLAADVDAIVGHMLSEMSVTTLQRIEEAGVVMVSPTSASHLLSQKDDPFLRIYPDAREVGEKVADYARNQLQLERLAVIYDRSNYAFCNDAKQAFRGLFEKQDGEVVSEVPFNGQDMEMSYAGIVAQVVRSGAQGVFILANPGDTALLCQQVAKQQPGLELFASEWSHSPRLHQLSGFTSDKLYMFQTVDEQDTSAAYRSFSRNFQERFGKPPWFASLHGFDATRLVLSGLERNRDPRKLKQTLLGLGTFHGVQSMITLDKYGDVERSHFVQKVTALHDTLVAML